MSENSFPFAGAEDEPFGEETTDVRNRRAVLVAGAVAAALVLGAGGYFFLGGNGAEEVATASGAPRAAAPHSVVPKAKAPAKTAKKLPAAYKAPLGRDPFKALYIVPAAVPAVAAASTTTATSPTSTGTAGTTAPTTTTGTSTTPTTSRYTLKLVSISKPSPEVRFTTWKVGTDSKTVIPAQRFGKYGEIVVLAFAKNAQGVVDKAIIQVGDDSPIDVKIGESVSVL